MCFLPFLRENWQVLGNERYFVYIILSLFKYKPNTPVMLPKSPEVFQQKQSPCAGHEDFNEIIQQIKKKANFEEILETADELYGLKNYNIMSLTPKRVKQLYESICRRVYRRSSTDHVHEWVGYELKIFVWLIVCHFEQSVSDCEKINRQCWEKYSRIFNNKNIDLIQYQAKLINCGLSQARKWEKHQEDFLIEIMRSNQNKSKWNEVAKDLYLKSEKRYFRNPKQIRERWLNHLDPQIRKQEWSPREDHLIVTTVLEKGRRWAHIAKMGGSLRTEHMVKNRYYALLRRQQKNNHQSYDKDVLTKKIKQKLEKLLKNQQKSLTQEKIPSQLQPEDAQKTVIKTQQQQMSIIENKIEVQDIGQQEIEEMMQEQQVQEWSYQKYLNKKLDQVELIPFINFEEHEELYSYNDPFDQIV